MKISVTFLDAGVTAGKLAANPATNYNPPGGSSGIINECGLEACNSCRILLSFNFGVRRGANAPFYFLHRRISVRE